MFLQIIETIKFQYTNWTHPENPQKRFELLLQMVGDWQYNCPVDLVTSTLKKSKIYKYRFEGDSKMQILANFNEFEIQFCNSKNVKGLRRVLN